MAQSNFQTAQYTAEDFVESAGAILFKLSTKQICLVNLRHKDQWMLAKGRRNVGENRQSAALREAKEETGFTCRLLPVTMTSRAPPAVEVGRHGDKPRTHRDVCEPFMVTHRTLGKGHLKIIWWYIAAIDEASEQDDGETQFYARLFAFDEAIKTLTFAQDREVVQQAIGIFNATFDGGIEGGFKPSDGME